MIIYSQQVFDRICLNGDAPSEFIEYISSAAEIELVTKVVGILGDHKLYIVKLHEPGLIEDLPGYGTHQCAYRQNLEYREIVRCKDCRMAYPWCQKFRDELGGSGFCPYGKKMEGVEE